MSSFWHSGAFLPPSQTFPTWLLGWPFLFSSLFFLSSLGHNPKLLTLEGPQSSQVLDIFYFLSLVIPRTRSYDFKNHADDDHFQICISNTRLFSDLQSVYSNAYQGCLLLSLIGIALNWFDLSLKLAQHLTPYFQLKTALFSLFWWETSKSSLILFFSQFSFSYYTQILLPLAFWNLPLLCSNSFISFFAQTTSFLLKNFWWLQSPTWYILSLPP